MVDYCLVKYNDLHLFDNFSVCKAIDLVDKCNIIDVTPCASIPDHSLLSWDIMINFSQQNAYCDSSFNSQDRYFKKFDLSQIPQDFLSDPECLGQVNVLIDKLEHSLQLQDDVDRFYDEWISVVEDNMYDKVPYKSIPFAHISNKKRKPAKQWWNDILSVLWTDVC